jgi:hypothetical protein
VKEKKRTGTKEKKESRTTLSKAEKHRGRGVNSTNIFIAISLIICTEKQAIREGKREQQKKKQKENKGSRDKTQRTERVYVRYCEKRKRKRKAKQRRREREEKKIGKSKEKEAKTSVAIVLFCQNQ